MNARFHAPDATTPGSTIELPEDEGQHLTRVLRLGEGASIRVFDGRGREFTAVVTEAGRRVVRVTLGDARSPAPEARVRVTLVQAVLKGDGMDGVIRDSVMMGAAEIQPVVTDRTEVSLDALARGSRVTRWERVAVSSVKQCGRAVVPPVRPPMALDAWLALPTPDQASRFVCVEPGAGTPAHPIGELDARCPAVAQLLIGPEGGWSPRELPRLLAGAHPISLGGRTLRADTAPTVALAALFTRWGEI